MNKDKFLRKIDYLRVSVTDLCNFRCVYCMPEEGIQLKNHGEILRLEELLKIIKISAEIGIKKVRFTGGEPLVRNGIIDLIAKVKEIPGIEDIALTTNGALLGDLAVSLKRAGITRVNISLDTLAKDKFSQITRVGNLETVLQGIEKSLAVGFDPVKLNVVVMRNFNLDEVLDFVALTKDKPLQVRFIELMPIGETEKWEQNKYVPAGEILEVIKTKYQVINSTGVTGAGPAKYMAVAGHVGKIGFINALSNHFCDRCNRLRLTSDGKLKPCLHSEMELDLKTYLRCNCSDAELKDIIVQAIYAKPQQHNLQNKDSKRQGKMMYQIGG